MMGTTMTRTEQMLQKLPEGTPVFNIPIVPISEEDRKNLSQPLRLYNSGRTEGDKSDEN